MRKPVSTYSSPSPATTVFTNFAPALMPTLERNSTSPISRNIRFADVVVYVTNLTLYPNLPIRMAIIRGPPAMPSFMGTGMPGTAKGMLPKRIPMTIPMKMVAMLGWSRRFIALPIRAATLLTDTSSPTTIMRSPTCSGILLEANISIP